MKRRAYIIFALLMVLMSAAIYSMVKINNGDEYIAAAQAQSVYKLDVASVRGCIYDCNLQPLTCSETKLIAAVAPTIETIGALEKATGGKYRSRLAAALEDGKPFTLTLESVIDSPFTDVFEVPQRYAENQLAPHIIGYLDAFGAGADGIELAMNDVLEESSGKAAVYYQVDAMGRTVVGGEHKTENTLASGNGGVALTIDSEIQAVVQAAAEKLGKGAVVVTEVPNCEIRAVASVPTFTQTDMQTAANDPNGALINRAFCAYAPGSVFKLVSAAARLENKIDDEPYTCTGSVNADGLLFHCINGKSHGTVNLQGALEKSCNCYFINSVRSLGGQTVLNMAYNLGLGEAQEFGRGLFTDSGSLPNAEALANTRALANFSFGQGDVTVTPLQMCGMINAIASGGVYTSPRLILGMVDENLTLTEAHSSAESTARVMSASTALTLQKYMKSTVTNGTAKAAQPQNCTVGVKTGTAQTGVFSGEDELLHFWYCGFVCDETSVRYCISVLMDSAVDDNGITAQVFKEIAETLGEIMQK